jgi:hypothetical protein
VLKVGLLHEIEDVLSVERDAMVDLYFVIELLIEGEKLLDFYSLGPAPQKVDVFVDYIDRGVHLSTSRISSKEGSLNMV